MKQRFFVFLLIAIALSACEPDAPFLPDDVTISTDGPLPAMYQELLDRVNDLRAEGCQCGSEYMPPVAPVSWNERIAAAAEQHSYDMADHDHFNHTGTDGSTGGERLQENGYQWRAYGENIAYGYNSAAAVFQGWRNSPGHCKNMMKASFEEMGASRVDLYWTQDFARPF